MQIENGSNFLSRIKHIPIMGGTTAHSIVASGTASLREIDMPL
jgi:hypothetical protein